MTDKDGWLFCVSTVSTAVSACLQYSQSNSSDIVAGCNKIIMFLTDGGTEKPKELFDQYNPNKTVC